MATMEHDWEFHRSFAQLSSAGAIPTVSSTPSVLHDRRDELRTLLDTFMQLDLVTLYPGIRVPTLVEHHPGYFFPDTYSRRIASLIPGCRMAVFRGVPSEFIADLSIARAFLRGE
jgi:hypothetical protein